jgi:ferrous iron transport protein B
MVAVDVLLGRQQDVPPPDAVLCIVDASNLERNLYLVSQILELELPVVLALNMTDVAAARGLTIDAALLSKRLGVPVVELVAHRKRGVQQLKAELAKAVDTKPPKRNSPFSQLFQDEVAKLESSLAERGAPWPRYLVERLLLDSGGYIESHVGYASRRARTEAATVDATASSEKIRARLEAYPTHELQAARQRLAKAGQPVPAVEAMARYGWVGEVLKDVVRRPQQRPVTLTDRIDRILTHRVWGTLVFVAMMVLIFQSIFTWAVPAMDGIEWLFEQLSGAVASVMPEGMLRSLVIDGVIAGVGGVLVFLPQILLLFLFIAVLEDCGYMARAAYLMDRLMSRIGLSGKSFIPLLSSFACAIPGVMAARVIEHRRDRLLTILVAPLMSCSARLPVYILLIAAFIPAIRLVGWDFQFGGNTYEVSLLGTQGLTFVAMYAVGIFAAILVALVLRKTILRGPTPPFVMELPSYKFPSIRTVLARVIERGWSFVKRAGTLILAISILVWAALYFPRDPQVERDVRAAHQAQADQVAALEKQIALLQTEGDMYADQMKQLKEQKAGLEGEIQNAVDGANIERSFLGRAGHLIEPIVKPLGWDWRIGCAAIASFPAREVIVGTLGVIYSLGGEEDEQSEPLRETLQRATWAGTDRPVFNIPVALSIMVFFALCAQCAATLVVIRRETNSWGWAIFTFAYMTALAYVGALATYQAGMWISS